LNNFYRIAKVVQLVVDNSGVVVAVTLGCF